MKCKANVCHIVMFDFAQLSEEVIATLIKEFEELSTLPDVLAFEWGKEANAEDSSLGFSHCFTLTFKDFEARTRYLNSREHREYEKEVMKYRSKVLVFDYQAHCVKELK